MFVCIRRKTLQFTTISIGYLFLLTGFAISGYGYKVFYILANDPSKIGFFSEERIIRPALGVVIIRAS